MSEKESGELNTTLNRMVIGGVIGASLGWFSHPKVGKKVLIRIGQSEIMRNVGRELGRTAQEMITEQALMSLKQKTTAFMNRDRMMERKKGTSPNKDTQEDLSEQYRALKEENTEMSKQLQLLEQKISEMDG